MAAIDPAVVIVKGDLSTDGTAEEWAAFEGCYRTAFGDRLRVCAATTMRTSTRTPTPATSGSNSPDWWSPCSTP